MNLEELKNYVANYYIKNGKVYLFLENRIVSDEEIVLKVKSARFIYNDAMKAFQKDSRLFGYSDNNIDRYLSKMMEKLSVNGEVNKFGINKLIRDILDSDGFFEENVSYSRLEDTKFSMFVGKDKENALAYLEWKFRNKNIQMSDFTIYLKNGKVVITFKKKAVFPIITGQVIHDLYGKEKVEYATKQLEIAKEEKNEVMVKYWEDTLLHMELLHIL